MYNFKIITLLIDVKNNIFNAAKLNLCQTHFYVKGKDKNMPLRVLSNPIRQGKTESGFILNY